MLRTVFQILIVFFLAAGLISCSKYKLESGNYIMSVKLPKTEKDSSKNVKIIVKEDKVTIQNPNQKKALVGSIKENNIRFMGDNGSEKVEFTGVLTGNNHVKGTVVQKSATDTTFSAEFSIVKSKEDKEKK